MIQTITKVDYSRIEFSNTRLIDRKTALRILSEHSWQADSQTTLDKSGEWVESGSSFNEVFGVKEQYNLRDLINWLGY